MKHQHFYFREQHFWLSPERVIYWEDEKALILSDSHFGKTGHFRKSGRAGATAPIPGGPAAFVLIDPILQT
jgi:hypothetical protein